MLRLDGYTAKPCKERKRGQEGRMEGWRHGVIEGREKRRKRKRNSEKDEGSLTSLGSCLAHSRV